MVMMIGVLASLLAAATGPSSARTARLRRPEQPAVLQQAAEGFENRIVELVAKDLGAQVRYTWWAQRRGFVAQHAEGGHCDLMPGVAERRWRCCARPRPYYRSTYVFVTREDGPDDRLARRPGAARPRSACSWSATTASNTPPAHALARRGIVANVRGYTRRTATTPSRTRRRSHRRGRGGRRGRRRARLGADGRLLRARGRRRCTVTPVAPLLDGPRCRWCSTSPWACGEDDRALRHEIDAALAPQRAEIDAILAATACRASTRSRCRGGVR